MEQIHPHQIVDVTSARCKKFDVQYWTSFNKVSLIIYLRKTIEAALRSELSVLFINTDFDNFSVS